MHSTLNSQHSTPTKFFCDTNVYRLAKYLRFAGFDTMTQKELSMLKISNICKKERRIFITRNKHIKKHLFCPTAEKENIKRLPRMEILTSENYLVQLKYILSKYPIDKSLVSTRCIKCNVLLKKYSQPYTIPNSDMIVTDVKYCPRCGRKYWKGTHYLSLELRV